MAKAYKLEPAELPSKRRYGLYDQIVTEFVESGNISAKVVIPEKSAKTMQIGLAKAIQVAEVKNVGVAIRNGEVYLFSK